MALYLLGIFMGAIDTGIVTPARTIIQNDLGVDDQTGIWMITIYTLAYAASIPVMGKLADRFGRKPVYLVSILLFGLGSLLCGLSEATGSFAFLVAARAIQAVGGGGILPIATAEFGTEVPVEKRGMALGLVGGVFGVANIFGSSAGSLILDVFGAHQWQYIFYVNLPISVVIIAGGLVFLPNHRTTSVAKIDLLGIALLVGMVLSLLYGLRNLDFFDLAGSLASTDVYPFLIAFAVLLPLFILAERRAEDPVTNLHFFRSRPIVLTLGIAFLTGFILMGTVFVPQFAENALHVPSGKGGYFVIILGLASGIGAPLSGRLTDALGPKRVLGFGLGASIVGALVLILWTIPQPSMLSVVVALALLGLGLGFSVGSPLNYMMLEQTRTEESNSALATLSLIRSIGTTIAPAIMVGFLAHSGTLVQDQLTSLLPTQVTAPQLPYAAELQAKIEQLRSDENMKDKLAGVEFPDLTAQRTIEIDPKGGGTLPDDLVELLKTADVTTITDRTKTVAVRMFEVNTPATIADIQSGVQQGIDGMRSGVAEMDDGLAKLAKTIRKMTDGIDGQTEGIAGMTKGIAGQTAAINKMATGIAGQTRAINGISAGIKGMTAAVGGMTKGVAGLDAALAGQRSGLASLRQFRTMIAAQLPPGVTSTPTDFLELLPPAVRSQLPASVTRLLTGVNSLAELDATIADLQSSIASTQREHDTLAAKLASTTAKLAKAKADRAKLVAARAQLTKARASLIAARAKLIAQRADLIAARAKLTKARDKVVKAREDLAAARTDLLDTIGKMTILRDAVPGAFEQAKQDYLAQIEALRPRIEATFAATLNTGFRDVYLTTAIACLLGLLLIAAYPARAPRTSRAPEAAVVPA